MNSSWATVTANIISWNKAYAIYPRSTFIDRKLYLLNLDRVCESAGGVKSPRHYDLIEEYEGLGWALDAHYYQYGNDVRYPFGNDRLLADSNTWVIAFDVGGVTPSQVPDGPLECSHWTFEANQCESREPHPSHMHQLCSTQVFWHPALRYWYSINYADSNYSWAAFLTLKCNREFARQVNKLTSAAKNSLLATLLSERKVDTWEALRQFDFKAPSDWEDGDDKVKDWWNEWRNGHGS